MAGDKKREPKLRDCGCRLWVASGKIATTCRYHSGIEKALAHENRIVLIEGVHIDEDGSAFPRLIEGKWTSREIEVYIPWEKIGLKKKVRIVAEVL